MGTCCAYTEISFRPDFLTAVSHVPPEHLETMKRALGWAKGLIKLNLYASRDGAQPHHAFSELRRKGKK
jgi:hypothetical protein